MAKGKRVLNSYHSIKEAMRQGEGVLFSSRTNKRISPLSDLARERGIPQKIISSREMDQMAPKGDHRGVLFVETLRERPRKGRHYSSLSEFLAFHKGEEDLLVLFLDGITDPHNLGAVLRSADQFGVALILLPENRSASINNTVAKVSVGAHAWVPTLKVKNPSRAMEELKKGGFWIYGAEMGGTRASEKKLKGWTCLILGSEGKGLSRLLRESCDALVSIPSYGHVDSLNVSVAAGILMYEVLRQRGEA